MSPAREAGRLNDSCGSFPMRPVLKPRLLAVVFGASPGLGLPGYVVTHPLMQTGATAKQPVEGARMHWM